MGAYSSVEEEHVLLVSFQVAQQLMNNLMLTTGACKREGEKMKKLHTYYLYKLFYFLVVATKLLQSIQKVTLSGRVRLSTTLGTLSTLS